MLSNNIDDYIPDLTYQDDNSSENLEFENSDTYIEEKFRINFKELPILCQINIFTYVDANTLFTLSIMKEFKYLVSFPNLERLYEGRIRNEFSQRIISHKPTDMKWSKFHKIITAFIPIGYWSDDAKKMYANFLNKDDNILELKILASLDPPVLPEIKKSNVIPGTRLTRVPTNLTYKFS